MVLKCLNHIYRLSTDVMFFTWSPFVWMKINWWQMRKDSAKRVEDIYWIAAPPSGYLGQLKKKAPRSQCGKAHTPRELSGVWYFMETSERKWFPGNCLGLLQRKRSLVHIAKEAVWVRLVSSFSLAWETEPEDTFNTSPSSLSLSLLT